MRTQSQQKRWQTHYPREFLSWTARVVHNGKLTEEDLVHPFILLLFKTLTGFVLQLVPRERGPLWTSLVNELARQTGEAKEALFKMCRLSRRIASHTELPTGDDS
jgi:hypothetical protein